MNSSWACRLKPNWKRPGIRSSVCNQPRQGIEFAQDLDFDFALLDIRLGDEDSVPHCGELRNRKLPFAFVTGFEDELILPAHLRSVPRFPKPYSIAAILGSIVRPETKAEQRQPSLSAVV